MNTILDKLYSKSNQLALICNGFMIGISIFQFTYNIKWLQILLIILSILYIFLIFCQEQHLKLILNELHTQNNIANINLEKLNKENVDAIVNIQSLNTQLQYLFQQQSNLLQQNNLAENNINKLNEHSKMIYLFLAHTLYEQFENSSCYNFISIPFFDKLRKIKDPNKKITDKFGKQEFTNRPAIEIVNELLYSLGPCGNI